MRKLLSLMLIAAVSIISSTAQIVTSTSISRTFQRVEEPPKPPKPWNHSGMFIGGNWAYFPSYDSHGLEFPGASTYGFELGYRLLLVDTKIGGFSWNVIKFQFSSNYDDASFCCIGSLATGVRYDSPRIRGGISLYGSFYFGAGLMLRKVEDRSRWMGTPEKFPKSTEIAVGVKLSRHFSIGVSVQSVEAQSYIEDKYDYDYHRWYESTTLSVPTVKFEYLF